MSNSHAAYYRGQVSAVDGMWREVAGKWYPGGIPEPVLDLIRKADGFVRTPSRVDQPFDDTFVRVGMIANDPRIEPRLQPRAASGEEAFHIPSVEYASWVFVRIAVDEAARLERNGEQADGWPLLVAATQWAAFLMGRHFSQRHFITAEEIQRIKSSSARKAAEVKHSKNRERKQRMLAWYSETGVKHKSVSAAARLASEKFHVTFETARSYISEFRKQGVVAARRP